MRKRSCDTGSAPIELALGVAVILLPAALVVLSFGPWLEARTLVRTGAAVTARYIAVTGNEDGVVPGLAEVAVASGLGPESVAVALCGGPAASLGDLRASTCMPLPRTGVVTVTVYADVPVVSTPWGDVGGLTVEATHVESLDPYRSMP